MTAVGLNLSPSALRETFRRPRSLVLATALQIVLLPAAVLAMIAVLRPDPVLALVLLAIAICPGGAMSNAFTHLVGGNLALSVMMTMVTTLLVSATAPVNCGRRLRDRVPRHRRRGGARPRLGRLRPPARYALCRSAWASLSPASHPVSSRGAAERLTWPVHDRRRRGDRVERHRELARDGRGRDHPSRPCGRAQCPVPRRRRRGKHPAAGRGPQLPASSSSRSGTCPSRSFWPADRTRRPRLWRCFCATFFSTPRS
jgi:hypothetical protein